MMIPLMTAANKTEFKVGGRKKLNTKYHSAVDSQVSLAATSYANNYAHSGSQGALLNGETGEVQAWQSGRNPKDEVARLASSNQSNFFPGFDSRGKVGIADDATEFTTQLRKPPSTRLGATATTIDGIDRE